MATEAEEIRKEREAEIGAGCEFCSPGRVSNLPETFIARLKGPSQRSESEGERLERMPPGACAERPVIDGRGEEIAQSELVKFKSEGD